LSKIIKAHEDMEEVAPFDFRNIEEAQKGKGKKAGRPGVTSKSAAHPPVKEVTRDPLEELEEIVKNRLLEVERKAEALEKEAYEKGYAQGEKDGFEYGKKNMFIVNEHLERVLRGLQGVPRKVFQDYREWFISACLAITKQLVRVELQTNTEAIVNLVNAVVDEAEEAHSLTLYLNPADIELMKKHTDFASWMQRDGSSCAFKPDNKLERGGCRMESEIQVVDAAVETRLALIERQLRQDGPTHEDSSSL